MPRTLDQLGAVPRRGRCGVRVGANEILRVFDMQSVIELSELAKRLGVSPYDVAFNTELRRLVVEKCLVRIREGDGILRYSIISAAVFDDVPKTSVRQRVLRLLESNDADFNNAEICAALGDDVDSVQVTNALNNLRQLGKVVRNGERGAARWQHIGHVKRNAAA